MYVCVFVVFIFSRPKKNVGFLAGGGGLVTIVIIYTNVSHDDKFCLLQV